MRILACILVLVFSAPVAAESSIVGNAVHFDPADMRCPKEAIPLMILGSYHFDSPGEDSFNLKTDDVLSTEKQKQLSEVLERLKTYAPTRIALEAPFKNSSTVKDYQAYLDGSFRLTANEIHQIGFRLAGQMHHETVYPVDFPMWMDGRVPAEIGVPQPLPKKDPAEEKNTVETPSRNVPAIYLDLQERMKRDSMLSVLRHINGWQYTRDDHATYMDMLAPDPYSDSLYGNTDPVSNWYKRNLRIFTNLYRIAEPNERLLLLIGSGHNAILRQLAIDSDKFCLVDTGYYLK